MPPRPPTRPGRPGRGPRVTRPNPPRPRTAEGKAFGAAAGTKKAARGPSRGQVEAEKPRARPVRPKGPWQPPLPLTGKQKTYLRGLAHALKPVVQIGHAGVTPGLIAAVSEALERHELIKVKVSSEAELDASEMVTGIEQGTRSQLAQLIGHTLVLYRRHDTAPKIVLPRKSRSAKRTVDEEE